MKLLQLQVGEMNDEYRFGSYLPKEKHFCCMYGKIQHGVKRYLLTKEYGETKTYAVVWWDHKEQREIERFETNSLNDAREKFEELKK